MACGAAAWQSRRLKRRQGDDPGTVFIYWSAITSYLIMFTLLRVVHLFDVDWLVAIFYLQTVAGAVTVVPLTYMLVGVMWGRPAARVAAEVVGAMATATLTLVFALGVVGPRLSPWGVEFLPASYVARVAIAAIYIVLPVAISIFAVVGSAGGVDRTTERRSVMFAAAVALIFVPGAIRYVVFVSGPVSLALATMTAAGALIGWRTYALGNS